MCHLNLCIKKWGSPSSFKRKQPFISLNSSAFIENLSSSEGARARARANHARNDAQKGCVMQLNGITLTRVAQAQDKRIHEKCDSRLTSGGVVLQWFELQRFVWECNGFVLNDRN